MPGNAKVVKSDLTPASLEASFKGQDAIISLVGNSGFAGQKALIDAAVAAGVKRFIPSEFGSNTESSAVLQRVPIFKAKRDIIEYAQTKENSGLSWTGFITGPIFDLVRAFLGMSHSIGYLLTYVKCLRTGFLNFNIAEKKAKIWDGGDVPFSTTNLSTIGDALVALLSNPKLVEESANKYVFVESFTITQNEVLKTLEKVSDAKWTVEPVDAEARRTEALEKLGKGDFSGVGTLIQAVILSKEGLSDLRPVGLWNDKLGLRKENLEEEVKKVL